MERFEEAVPLYLKACEVEGKTERTVQSYAETLRHVRRAVDQLQLPNSVRAFRPAHVYLFMGWVRERGVSAGTQHRRQREVKAFFSWCRRMDYVEENPFMRVPMVRREQKVVQPFAKEDVTTLLAACNPKTYVGSRMRAMIGSVRTQSASRVASSKPRRGAAHDLPALSIDVYLQEAAPHLAWLPDFLLPSMSASLQRTHWFALQRSPVPYRRRVARRPLASALQARISQSR